MPSSEQLYLLDTMIGFTCLRQSPWDKDSNTSLADCRHIHNFLSPHSCIPKYLKERKVGGLVNIIPLSLTVLTKQVEQVAVTSSVVLACVIVTFVVLLGVHFSSVWPEVCHLSTGIEGFHLSTGSIRGTWQWGKHSWPVKAPQSSICYLESDIPLTNFLAGPPTHIPHLPPPCSGLTLHSGSS